MQSGDNGAVVSTEPHQHQARPDGLFGRPNKRVKRNRTACFVSSVLAIVCVSLVALSVLFVTGIINNIVSGDGDASLFAVLGTSAFLAGAATSLSICLFNFFLFPVTLPIIWFIISQSTGRFIHRGISNRWAYIRPSAVYAFSAYTGPIAPTGEALLHLRFSKLAGGLVAGGLIGAIAGLPVGALFVAILRPASQLSQANMTAAEVFD